MIHWRLLRKYILWSTLSLLAFVLLGYYINQMVFRLLHNMDQEQAEEKRFAPVFLAKLVDNLEGENLIAKIKLFNEIHSDMGRGFFKLSLFDANGNLLYGRPQKNINWNKIQMKLPKEPYEAYTIAKSNYSMPMPPPNFDMSPPPNSGDRPQARGSFDPQGPRPPGPPDGNFRPRPGPPGGFEKSDYIIRLNNNFFLYLENSMDQGPGPGMPFREGSYRKWIPWISSISLFVSLLFGVIFSLSLVYFSMKRGIIQADKVISEMQSGNLKARFKISRKDAFGDAMRRFNFMADEIEKLVQSLKESESAKNKLLQELAHDLRTPIASLKGLLETLLGKWQHLDVEVREEFLQLSLSEVNYFAKLVEDLLFISQMQDSSYTAEKQSMNVVDLLTEQVDNCSTRYKSLGKNVSLNFEAPEELTIFANPYLLKRLFINALDNFYSFAKSEVKIELEELESSILIRLTDDGPGFPTDQLEGFGKKKASRSIQANSNNGRISVGIGSLVMNKIVENHNGKMIPKNIQSKNSLVQGAQLEIYLEKNKS
ncbi:MAG: HAMP domain-containing sensor histidine kinase [Bdellovibrionota bacterium]|nr:HAMP domain-containing sensor histidine kinase [Bdellovibrionota bacterium]